MNHFELSDGEKAVTISALYAYQAETTRYLSSYKPNGSLIHDPCCEAEASRVKLRNEEKVLLEQRAKDINNAIAELLEV
jgi:hypothetical protein